MPSRNGCTDRVAVQSETRLGMCITRSAHWRHLANTTERRKRRRRCALWLPSLQRLVPVRTQITSHHIKYRRCSSRRTVCQQSAVARFLLQPPPSGTLYPTTFNPAPSLSSFRRQLKTFLFHQSFPDIIL